VVAYNMSEWRSFMAFRKAPRSDLLVLLVTFFHTVIFDLTIAIQIGLLLALVLLLHRLSKVSEVKKYIKSYEVDDETDTQTSLNIPKDVEVYEINGPFFFGVAHKFEEAIKAVHAKKPKVRIVRLRKAPFIDSTGLHHLEQLFEKSKANHIEVVLSGINKQPREILIRSGLYKKIGGKNICNDINLALVRAKEILLEKEARKEAV
jgi:sulfate permease, SulP family